MSQMASASGSGMNLGDLLERANKLSNSVLDNAIGMKGIESSSLVVPPIERNLNQVFEQGERLWHKTAAGTQLGDTQKSAGLDLKTSLLLGQSDSSVPRISDHLKSFVSIDIAQTSATQSQPLENDLETFLRQQREQMLVGLIDETLKSTMEETERVHWRQLMSEWEGSKERMLKGIPSLNVTQMVPQPQPSITSHGLTPASRSSQMNQTELIFAKEVNEYTMKIVKGGMAPNLGQLFFKAIQSLPDKTYQSLWDQVNAMLSVKIRAGVDLIKQRTSVDFRLDVISKAVGYLQKQFKEHMQMIVCGNLSQAQRGGTPGTVALVQAYLNVKLPTGYHGSEDGQLDGRHPTWALLYYCIRAGDLNAALELCQQRHVASLNEFIAALRECATNDNRLSPDTETKLKIEYRRKVRSCSDVFKRASYCMIACCDPLCEHGEVGDKLEDWLWMRLIQARHGELMINNVDLSRTTASEHFTLTQLQKLILMDYGEQHFGASETPLLYFTALWLTGQFESAIDFLARQNDTLRCHGTHIGLATHQACLLLTPIDTRAKLCISEPNDPKSLRRLNLVRLILMYNAKFEMSDLRETLNYLYFLRTFKTPSGESVFATSLTRLVLQTKEFGVILGSIEPDGTRKPGLIDNYDFDPKTLVDFVASQCEDSGQFDAAVGLYDLAGNHTKVFNLMSSQLSQIVSQPSLPGSDRERITQTAINIGTRYRRHGYSAEESIASVFFLLLDVGTFFDLFHGQRYIEAIDVMRKLGIVPTERDQVEQLVKTFHMIPEEVRRVLSDILLAVMMSLNAQYKEIREKRTTNVLQPGVDQAMDDLRNEAKSLILYAGMIPYVLPSDTTARLVRLDTELQ